MSILNPFQLLELNVISAQDLAPVSRAMRTYAVAWVHPDRKLSTRVDTHGHANPTWNDKFVFRVDEDFLLSDTSAVMIEIYALHWFKDVHVGTVRILVGNLIPGAQTSSYGKEKDKENNNLGMRFVALQVRRQSGRPQGILNIGVAVLHSAMRSMPIYSQLSTSAVGYRELMGEDDPTPRSGAVSGAGTGAGTTPGASAGSGGGEKRRLRRTKSDTSSMIGSEIRAKAFRSSENKKKPTTKKSTATKKEERKTRRSKESSVVSASSSVMTTGKKFSGGSGVSYARYNKGKIIRNDDSHENSNSVSVGEGDGDGDYFSAGVASAGVAYVEPQTPVKKGKTGRWRKAVSSLLGHSEVGSYEEHHNPNPNPNKGRRDNIGHYNHPPKETRHSNSKKHMASPMVKPSPRFNVSSTPRRKQTGKSPYLKFAAPYEYGTPRKTPALAPGRGGPIYITESELGPSASEVAAAISKKPPAPAAPAAMIDEMSTESSVLEGWSMDESVEGLRSKLDRWRTELPPVYDRGEALSSFTSTEPRHIRRHTDGGVAAGDSVGGSVAPAGNGLFSCFSNICGVECSIVCGGGGASGGGGSAGSRKGGMSERIIRSPSADNLNYK